MNPRLPIDELIKSIVQGTLTSEQLALFEEEFSEKFDRKLALLSQKIKGLADPIFPPIRVLK